MILYVQRCGCATGCFFEVRRSGWFEVPFLLELLNDFSLGVVAHDSRVDEAAEVELFRSELRHGRYRVGGMEKGWGRCLEDVGLLVRWSKIAR